MKLRGGAAIAHGKDVNLTLFGGGRVGTDLAHVHDDRQHRLGAAKIGHAHGDGAEALDLALGGDGAFGPGVGAAGSRVVDQAQALTFRVLEIERHMPGPLGDLGDGNAIGLEVGLPPLERGFALNAERGAHDRMGAPLFGGGRPVEKGDVGAGRGFAVAIKQVIGGGIVLVDGALDQPQAKDLGIKRKFRALAVTVR